MMTKQRKRDPLSLLTTILGVRMLVIYPTAHLFMGEEAAARALAWYGDTVTRIIYPWLYGQGLDATSVTKEGPRGPSPKELVIFMRGLYLFYLITSIALVLTVLYIIWG